MGLGGRYLRPLHQTKLILPPHENHRQDMGREHGHGSPREGPMLQDDGSDEEMIQQLRTFRQ